MAAEREHAGIPKSKTKFRLSSISDRRGIITKVIPLSVTADS